MPCQVQFQTDPPKWIGLLAGAQGLYPALEDFQLRFETTS